MKLATIVVAAALSLGGCTENICGTAPLSYPAPGSSWSLETEEYSCGVSSQWTEVRAIDKVTGARILLLTYDTIEEFTVKFRGGEVELIASDRAGVKQFTNRFGPFQLRYTFAPLAQISPESLASQSAAA